MPTSDGMVAIVVTIEEELLRRIEASVHPDLTAENSTWWASTWNWWLADNWFHQNLSDWEAPSRMRTQVNDDKNSKKWLNKSELNLVHKTQIFHPQTNTIGWPIWADLKIIGFGRTSSKTHLIVLYFTQKWQYTNMRYKQNSYKCYNLTTIWHQIPRLRYHQKLWCLFPSYKVVQRKKCVEKSK